MSGGCFHRPAEIPLWLFCGATVLIAVTSCGSSTTTTTGPSQVPSKCEVQTQLERATFPQGGGASALHVTTNRECSWTAKSDAAWVTLSPGASGQGDATVQFTVATNNDPATRTAGLVVNDQRMQISQDAKPCDFRLSSTTEQVDPSGGERTIQVSASSAQCTWTATSGLPWVTITAGSGGRGPGAVTLKVAPSDGPSRTGTVSIAGLSVNVVQSVGCDYRIDPTGYAAPASGGGTDVNVQTGAGCSWSATSTVDWITVAAGATGSGPGRARLTVAPSSGIARTGTAQVAGQTVTVTQASGCTVSASPTSITANAAATSSSIQVTTAAGCSWQAATGTPWITITSSASGTGSGSIQLAIAANTGPGRQGSVTVADQTITVAQAGGCTFSIGQTDQDVPASGAQGSVSVTTGAGCSWTAASADSWLSVSTPSGNGPGPMQFTAASNTGPPRSGSITVAGQVLTVRQASACTWTFSPPYSPFDANGGNGNVLVIVAGVCTWTVTNNTDWITITAGQSGAGNGLLQFVVSAEPWSESDRNADDCRADLQRRPGRQLAGDPPYHWNHHTGNAAASAAATCTARTGSARLGQSTAT